MEAELKEARIETELAKSELEDALEEAKEYQDYVVNENSRLEKELKEAKYNINILKQKLNSYKANETALYNHDNNSIVFQTTESNFYDNEKRDLLLDILKNSRNTIRQGSRREHIIMDIINNNNKIVNHVKPIQEIENAVRGCTEINNSTKRKLKRLGFEIISENNHYKLEYKQDSRYRIIIPRTSSDCRAWRNIITQINHLLF